MARFSEHDVGLARRRYRDQTGSFLCLRSARLHIFWVMSARRTTPTGRKRRSTPFIRATWKENPTSRKRWIDYLRGKPGIALLRRNAKGVIDGVLREEPPQAGRECLSHDRRAHPGDRGGSDARRLGAALRSSSILTMATFSRWFQCHRSIRTLLFPASRRRIGRTCAKTKQIRSSIARSALSRLGRLSSSLPARRIAQRSGQNALRLRRRRQLWRSLFPMLDFGKGRQPWHVLALADAIKVSCNSFFYQFGNAAGIDAIDRDRRSTWASAKQSGIDITGSNRAFCLARTGCGFTVRAKNGRKLTRRMFRSGRATTLSRRCNWPWSTRRSQMAGHFVLPAPRR